MQKKSLIKQNILQFIKYKGISKYKFYSQTGITRGVLDQNNGMSEENTAKFLAQYPEISPEWLLTGKGEMLRQPTDLTINQSISGDNNIQASNSNIGTSSVSNAQLLAEIKELKQQIAERDKTINNLIRQQEKLINKLTL